MLDAGGDLGSAAEGSAIELEVAGSGPVQLPLFHSLLLPDMCSSLACLSTEMCVGNSSVV